MDLMNQSKEYGTERINFAINASSENDWDKWADPKNEFIFQWGTCWNNTIEYKVANFASEVGFFIDILGCDCNSISEDYAMVMGPKKEFYLSFRKEESNPTPADAITIEFMIENLEDTVKTLKERGLQFDQEIKQEDEKFPMFTARFKTPAGIAIKLWNFKKSN